MEMRGRQKSQHIFDTNSIRNPNKMIQQRKTQMKQRINGMPQMQITYTNNVEKQKKKKLNKFYIIHKDTHYTNCLTIKND